MCWSSRQPIEMKRPHDEHYEYACANPIRIEADGCVSAPDGPGLGLDLDWNRIERGASLLIDSETM